MSRFTFVTIIATLALASLATAETECFQVDIGFATKPCGKAPTTDEFNTFVSTQAAAVADLKARLPCGFTTCPKFKRDTEFSYKRSQAAPADAEDDFADLADIDIEEREVEERSIEVQEEVEESQVERRSLHAREIFDPRDLDLDEDELIARNLPVMRGADGKLVLFRSIPFPEPVKRDTIEERAVSTEASTVNKRAEEEYALALRSEVELSEDELIARNLPTMTNADGDVVLFRA